VDKRKNKHIVYLSLGTNLGNKAKNIEDAKRLIKEHAGNILNCSNIYKTEAWQMNEKTPVFYNIALALATELSPHELLEVTQSIERKLGRKEKSLNNEYKNRIIDIDILLMDNLILNTEKLTIPHPLMHKRNFVLYPLNEIAKDVIHPVFAKTINELKENSCDILNISTLKQTKKDK
tara:strand:- start:18830 stop:19360 length:531 start_codon:yes stop_codon:yes gene_type:complete